jgi:hypothetical protein
VRTVVRIVGGSGLIFGLLITLGQSGVAGATAVDPLNAESALASAERYWDSQGALGEYRDLASGAVVVDVPTAAAVAFDLGSISAIDTPVKIRTVDLDKATRDEALSRLGRILGDLSTTGVSAAFFFDARDAKIYLDTTASESAVDSGLGDLGYLVSYHAGGVVDTSRCADSSPFWGGAALQTCSPSACTTGFDVKNGAGTAFLLTAGHCFGDGYAVKTPAGTAVGTTTMDHCGLSPNVDVAEIQGKSYGPWIYVGTMAGTGKVVMTALDPTAAGNYRYSGATSFENLITAQSTSVTVLSPHCGQETNVVAWSATGQYGNCPETNGDSGAPAYLNFSDHVSARGIMTARGLGFPYFCYGPKWSSIASALGVTIWQ